MAGHYETKRAAGALPPSEDDDVPDLVDVSPPEDVPMLALLVPRACIRAHIACNRSSGQDMPSELEALYACVEALQKLDYTRHVAEIIALYAVQDAAYLFLEACCKNLLVAKHVLRGWTWVELGAALKCWWCGKFRKAPTIPSIEDACTRYAAHLSEKRPDALKFLLQEEARLLERGKELEIYFIGSLRYMAWARALSGKGTTACELPSRSRHLRQLTKLACSKGRLDFLKQLFEQFHSKWFGFRDLYRAMRSRNTALVDWLFARRVYAHPFGGGIASYVELLNHAKRNGDDMLLCVYLNMLNVPVYNNVIANVWIDHPEKTPGLKALREILAAHGAP